MLSPESNRQRIARSRRARLALSPFIEFARLETTGGIALMACTALALGWANSPWSESYFRLIETPIGLTFGLHRFGMSLTHWVNDFLMAILFLVVGLEIKREFTIGELSSRQSAMLPIAAAVGGMIAPALLYLLVTSGEARRGWGIPMATDIAFSLGVLALLGRRIPVTLKVLLTALAIVDDLGAVIVIAIAYTHSLAWLPLAIAAALLMALVVVNRLGVRILTPYLAIGFAVWVCLMASGVHATIAGVLVAMTMPIWQRVPDQRFSRHARRILDRYDADEDRREGHLAHLDRVYRGVQLPAERLQHQLHPWVTYLIVPLFALVNAGVRIPNDAIQTLTGQVPTGIILGLVVGKPLGIIIAIWLTVKLGLTSLGGGVTWRHVIGLGFVAGIGFTMSIFIANLAFVDPNLVVASKAGILVGSVLAAAVGVFTFGLPVRSVPTQSMRDVTKIADSDEANRAKIASEMPPHGLEP